MSAQKYSANENSCCICHMTLPTDFKNVIFWNGGKYCESCDRKRKQNQFGNQTRLLAPRPEEKGRKGKQGIQKPHAKDFKSGKKYWGGFKK